jgi:5'(3')-deoxyribonucleotidase
MMEMIATPDMELKVRRRKNNLTMPYVKLFTAAGLELTRFEILLDMDGIIANCLGGIVRIAKEKYNIELSIEGMSSWDMGDSFGCPEITEEIMNTKGFFRNLEVFPGVKKYVDLLSKHHNITICSSPKKSNPHCIDEKIEWLKEHFPNITKHIFTGEKHLCVGDVFIDDSPKHLEENRSNYKVTIGYPFNADSMVDLRAGDYKDMARAWSLIYFWVNRTAGITLN